jgi:serine/threonine protein kinase
MDQEPAPTSLPESLVFPEIPGYELQQVLGRGGMGRVYQAKDRQLQRAVAIKTLVDAFDDELILRFETEIQAIAGLDHVNIAKVFGSVRTSTGTPACVMELLRGGSLADHVRVRPPSYREAAQVVATLAVAMEYSHQCGIIHRDLKPANVMLAHACSGELRTADLRIVDFGLAKLVNNDAGVTQTGQVLGTPAYMAPEQASGLVHRIGPPADVYALGGMLYELLVGKPPFLANDPVQTLMMVIADEPISPRELNRAIPRDLETICLKCLEKKASRRYSSAGDLAQDLRLWLEGCPIQARPVRWYGRVAKWVRRNPWPTTAAALLTLMALVSTGASFFLQAAYEETRQANQDLSTSNQELEKANHAANAAFEISRDTLEDVVAGVRNNLAELPQAEQLYETSQRELLVMYQRLLEIRQDDPTVLKSTIEALWNVWTLDYLKEQTENRDKILGQISSLLKVGRGQWPDDPWFKVRTVRFEIEQWTATPSADYSERGLEQVLEIENRIHALQTQFPGSREVLELALIWQLDRYSAAASQGDVTGVITALTRRVELAREYFELGEAREPQAAFQLVQALISRATIESLLSNLETTSSLLSEATAILAAMPDGETSSTHRRLTAQLQRLRGTLALQQGDLDQADSEFRLAIASFLRLMADFPNDMGTRYDLAQVYFEFASGLWAADRTTESRECLELAQQQITTILAIVPDHFAAQSLQTRIEAALEAHQ